MHTPNNIFSVYSTAIQCFSLEEGLVQIVTCYACTGHNNSYHSSVGGSPVKSTITLATYNIEVEGPNY